MKTINERLIKLKNELKNRKIRIMIIGLGSVEIICWIIWFLWQMKIWKSVWWEEMKIRWSQM